MIKERYCRVAVPLPLHETYHYEIPEDMADYIRPGSRVLVPFGPRRLTGYVLELCKDAAVENVRPVLEILDEHPVFDSIRQELFQFASDYYVQPIGEVIKTGLPAGINQESRIVWSITEKGIEAGNSPGISARERRVLLSLEPGKSYYTKQAANRCAAASYSVLNRLVKKGWLFKIDQLDPGTTKAKFTNLYSIPESINPIQVLDELSRAPKQKDIFQFLTESCQAEKTAIELVIPKAAASLAALVKKGFVEKAKVECYRDCVHGMEGARCDEVILNVEQQSVFDDVLKSMDKGEYKPFLLHGVTGSGKTEVYLRLADKALSAQRQVLILVPEIALTPQLVSRFVKRFGSGIAVSHSGMSNSERYDQWRRMLKGQANLCIGTRSAVFSPLKNPGLIVVDEEHDSSYKQDDGVPYNARDLALYLGKQTNAVVVLGSATPSLESYHAAKSGRYKLLSINNRATSGELPEVHILDLAKEIRRSKEEQGRKPKEDTDQTERPKSLPTARYALSRPMIDALVGTLESDHQAILFLNRRGYSSHAFCLECKRTVMCPNCAVSLTPHYNGSRLHCHYCGFTKAANTICEHCGGHNFFLAGLGTEQLQTELEKLFPSAKIARLDRDTTANKGALEKILSDFANQRHDILVGTQIVTKGHDFPAVTLVGVLCADVGMNLPDFRSSERTFQIISQVSGRAGRGDHPGKVIIQTFDPKHHALKKACNHDYRGFYKIESGNRSDPKYPPFVRIALVKAKSKKDMEARSFLIMIANSLRQSVREEMIEGVSILGPTQSALSRLMGYYRYQLMIKAPSPATLIKLVKQADVLANKWKRSDVQWRLDVDPQSVL